MKNDYRLLVTNQLGQRGDVLSLPADVAAKHADWLEPVKAPKVKNAAPVEESAPADEPAETKNRRTK